MGIVKEETADSVTVQMPVPGAVAETVKKADVKKRESARAACLPV
jgi:hypothetical protein